MCNTIDSSYIGIHPNRETIKYENQNVAVIEFILRSSNTKSNYFSKYPLNDSLFIISKLSNCNNKLNSFWTHTGCGVADIKHFNFASSDTSIFEIDTSYTTNCLRYFDICPYGIIKVRCKKDGTAFLILKNNRDTINAEVRILNNKLQEELFYGYLIETYSRKILSKSKLLVSKYNKDEFKRWEDIARKNCK